jgi:hypothetical protein
VVYTFNLLMQGFAHFELEGSYGQLRHVIYMVLATFSPGHYAAMRKTGTLGVHEHVREGVLHYAGIRAHRSAPGRSRVSRLSPLRRQ